MKEYRDQGAIGAILDEYQKAIEELIECISTVGPKELQKIVDPDTQDKDCVSIQSILSHVIQAGYTYAIEIKKWMGETLDYVDLKKHDNVQNYIDGLRSMFQYNEDLFDQYPDIKMEEHSKDKKMLVRWGQTYDVEQICEHAIVHILRHRRQIERFKLRIKLT